MGSLMARYYEQVDSAEKKRVYDAARSKFAQITAQHHIFVAEQSKIQN